MTQTVEEIAAEIISHEGGFVSDPDDPGGATNFGVTIHTAKQLGLDLDNDGDVDINDVKLITMEQAENIFIKQYFYKKKIDKLPDCLHAAVFDHSVNSGNNAIKILQRLINRVNKTTIAVDGGVGSITLRECTKMLKTLGNSDANDAYCVARRNWYYRIATGRPRLRKYVNRRNGKPGGWIRRADSFLNDNKYRITQEQHEGLIAQWA